METLKKLKLPKIKDYGSLTNELPKHKFKPSDVFYVFTENSNSWDSDREVIKCEILSCHYYIGSVCRSSSDDSLEKIINSTKPKLLYEVFRHYKYHGIITSYSEDTINEILRNNRIYVEIDNPELKEFYNSLQSLK